MEVAEVSLKFSRSRKVTVDHIRLRNDEIQSYIGLIRREITRRWGDIDLCYIRNRTVFVEFCQPDFDDESGPEGPRGVDPYIIFSAGGREYWAGLVEVYASGLPRNGWKKEIKLAPKEDARYVYAEYVAYLQNALEGNMDLIMASCIVEAGRYFIINVTWRDIEAPPSGWIVFNSIAVKVQNFSGRRYIGGFN